jgi:DNA invertase Pin-like site-specific DNA recombinase
MTTFGYARVSTTDQDLTVQMDALKVAGCDLVRFEKVSGTSLDGRDELATLLDFIRPGDILVVTRIDRLARSIADLAAIVRTIESKGAALRATEQPIDTSTAAGRCFLQMLGVFAEFETNLRRERQLEGIAKAKLAGKYRGRPGSIDAAKVAELRQEGLGASEIARRLGIARASVYRLLAGAEIEERDCPTGKTGAVERVGEGIRA